MTKHKYQIGLLVRFAQRRGLGADAPKGSHRVERLLPDDGAEFQYRIKSTLDGRERVVRESQIDSRIAD